MILAHAGDPNRAPMQFHLHPDVLAVAAVVALLYWYAIRRLGPRLAPGPRPLTRGQRAGLWTSLGLFVVMSEWPVHDLSEGYLYSVHMVQHLVYTLVLPPLAIRSTPAWLWRWALRPVMPLFRLLVRPLFALLVFNGFLALTHWPVLVELAVESGPAHLAQHVVLVATAVLMWWPVVSPLPELQALPPPLRIGYLFLQSLVPTVPASFLTFASDAVYRVYGSFPRLWGIDTVEDQQFAGAVMKLGGGIILWTLMTVVFFRWAAREKDGPAGRPTNGTAPIAAPAIHDLVAGSDGNGPTPLSAHPGPRPAP